MAKVTGNVLTIDHSEDGVIEGCLLNVEKELLNLTLQHDLDKYDDMEIEWLKEIRDDHYDSIAWTKFDRIAEHLDW